MPKRTDSSRATNQHTPRIGIGGESVPHSGHVCAFFQTPEEKYRTLAPFFSDAIAAGDRILNVVDGDRVDAHLESLRAAQVPVDAAIRTDRLRVQATEDTYLRGGTLDLEGMLDMVRGAIASAEREGRTVRTCGEMSWLGRHQHVIPKALEYEARVNELLDGNDCTLLCVYDTPSTPSSIISDILATHEYALINGRLRRNPYYVSPEEYLAMLRARH